MISYLENLRDKQNKEEVLWRRHQAKKRLEIPPEPETPVKVKKIEIIGNESELNDNNGKQNEHLLLIHKDIFNSKQLLYLFFSFLLWH